MKSLEDSLDRFSDDFLNERNQPPMQERDFVGAGLALPGSEQGCEQVMAVAHKKGAASGAPTCKQNADAPRATHDEYRARHRLAPTKEIKYETGAELLKRILVERKKKWEEKNPDKKYKEPAAPDTSNLPALPKGWVWASLGQCFRVAVGATPSRKESSYWNGLR